MTRLFDDPSRFAEDAAAGFADAHRAHVRPVPGGVVRARRPARPKVAVLTGGGSGHYPAFCGVVGPGFADGAVIGNVFTSPSAEQAVSVGRAAESGAGVLYLFGNYAGDVMNFGLAARRLTSEGIPATCFAVTDDVASAPAEETAERRGIAGDFVVFKAASAAAEEGADLDEVLRVASHANDRTRTLGVAFAGCTIPGQDAPLFTVPEGRMGLGLGIHGEPGVAESPLPSAAELASTLVEGLLKEAPAGGGTRVTAILNGLGGTKYEELYVVWRHVGRLLADAGLEVVLPEVGELVTSLDMAGCSLTLCWLDAELERLWAAPADTPAYRRGTVAVTGGGAGAAEPAVSAVPAGSAGSAGSAASPGAVLPQASGDAVAVSSTVVELLDRTRDLLHREEERLGRLDAVAGDGDHGRGMCKGVDAALAAARRAHGDGTAPAGVLAAAGDAWAAEAGGTSGALWGAGLRALGERLPDDRSPSAEELAAGAAGALDAVRELGGAQVGDKTLVDALAPFVAALAEGRGPRAAADAAEEAARETAAMRPRLGRARPLAERSVGTPDPGAVSLALVLKAVASGPERG
ncbi:D-erythrulose kinase [Mangrovactinospora gilvigrisea]|uniref:D-erythrulose kinase n=1 Tax=Mangrovactinospora gilvigrisea TaxID=1428644 RepID=A0A1J7C298_9ACTN|nr:dihydroxyacetone kinase family protein [Mangrovactinospora gilvigrisea]OIV35700.1 D-erythrulose kinase [Mangrovactinospora gilvigrisea]